MKILFPVLGLVCASCFSTHHRLDGHQNWVDTRAGAPPDIELQVGERQIALDRGTRWGIGGYSPGLASEDVGVVKVLYEESSLSGDVYLQGVAEGEARVYYGNAWILPYGDGGESLTPESILMLREEHDESVQHSPFTAQFFIVKVRANAPGE